MGTSPAQVVRSPELQVVGGQQQPGSSGSAVSLDVAINLGTLHVALSNSGAHCSFGPWPCQSRRAVISTPCQDPACSPHNLILAPCQTSPRPSFQHPAIHPFQAHRQPHHIILVYSQRSHHLSPRTFPSLSRTSACIMSCDSVLTICTSCTLLRPLTVSASRVETDAKSLPWQNQTLFSPSRSLPSAGSEIDVQAVQTAQPR